jgi:hypothetical protein
MPTRSTETEISSDEFDAMQRLEKMHREQYDDSVQSIKLTYTQITCSNLCIPFPPLTTPVQTVTAPK